MTLSYVETLLGVNSMVVVEIYTSIEKRLLHKLGKTAADPVPEELQYIVDEVTIARFNRIGSEGMETENVEGHAVKYFKGDIFVEYEQAIAQYVDQADGVKNDSVVRFI